MQVVFLLLFSRRKELCVKQKPMELRTTIKAYSWYNIGFQKLKRFSKVVAGWFVYTGLRQTIRNFSQDKSSHIWTVTNAFQVKIWNGGW